MSREELNGHVIEIENDVLRVDGEEIAYITTDGGYQIYYESPKPTLVEAARSYVETQPAKD